MFVGGIGLLNARILWTFEPNGMCSVSSVSSLSFWKPLCFTRQDPRHREFRVAAAPVVVKSDGVGFIEWFGLSPFLGVSC